MRLNQMFKGMVPIELGRDLARLIGLKDLDDVSYFTKYDVRRLDCVNRIHPLLEKLRMYYTPSRTRQYLDRDPMPEHTVIVILRQVLRLHNYSLRTKERNVGCAKVTLYQIVNHNLPPRALQITKRTTKMAFN